MAEKEAVTWEQSSLPTVQVGAGEQTNVKALRAVGMRSCTVDIIYMYIQYTKKKIATIQSALSRPLHRFTLPNK